VEAVKILDDVGKKAGALVQTLCDMERKRPFTLNTGRSREIQQRTLKMLEENWRREHPPPTSIDAEASVDLPDPDDLQNLIDQLHRFGCRVVDYPSDLRLIAQVLTYFEIAVNRIADNIAMFIENELICKFNMELKTKLSDNLRLTGVHGPAWCEALVAGGEDSKAEINALQRKKIALTNALNTFQQPN
jgi:hypothetical protein